MKIDLKVFHHGRRKKIINLLNLPKAKKQSYLKTENSIEIVNQLIAEKYKEEAIHFIALGLPNRQAAWWGFLAAHSTESHNNDINIQTALSLCEKWVRFPSEELRLKANFYAESLDLYSATGWLAKSIFWCGDNIAPEKKPLVKPSEFMVGMGINNCIQLTLNSIPHKEKNDSQNHYLKQGIHIAMGGNGVI